MLRLLGLLVLVLAGAVGILFLDYNRTVQQADAGEQATPSFRSYIEAVPARLVSLTGSSRSSVLPLTLAEMLPQPPKGWTTRPLDEKDIAGFQPKSGQNADPASIDLVKSVGSSPTDGAESAVLAYEDGERRVVFQLLRHPDSIFSGQEEIDRRFELQIEAAVLRGRPAMTIRGLDIIEEFLGDGMRARYFTASVGAQIKLRVLASKRLKDADLAGLLQTLNVQAMNAAVIDRKPGLGEVPVIVVASAMSEADRAAYEADRSDQAKAATLHVRDLRAAFEAGLAAQQTNADATDPAETTAGTGMECNPVAGGVKRCRTGQGD